ncbi:hypothetical protein Efla_001867 [Eimeria flavescens]
MKAKFAAFLSCCLAVAGATMWRKITFSDLSAVENLYALIAKTLTRPQYIFHLHDIFHFRERSDLPQSPTLSWLSRRAMGDFMMREAQPIAFRGVWNLEATYASRAEEDGEEVWAAVPKKAAADVLTYDEVYVEGKLHAPTDPASIIMDRSHSFPNAVVPQLLPPHPTDAQPLRESRRLPRGTQQRLIGLQLYAPVTCAEAPRWPSGPEPDSTAACQAKHSAFLFTIRQAEKIEGVLSLQVDVEVSQLREKHTEEDESRNAKACRPHQSDFGSSLWPPGCDAMQLSNFCTHPSALCSSTCTAAASSLSPQQPTTNSSVEWRTLWGPSTASLCLSTTGKEHPLAASSSGMSNS